MREHDSNFRPPALPGAGWRFIAVGHESQPGERYEVAVAVGPEGVQVFRDRCIGRTAFELIEYMAVVAFRELPR